MEVEEKAVSNKAEEYLEIIFRLEKKTGSARTLELARELKVVPGSVTNTIQRLKRRGLILHEPYKGVKLTEKGRKLAINVLRKHRLAERLLTDVLGLDWSRAHDAACKLEHGIAEDIVKPLEKALRHPKTCPHGNPVPTACGGIIEEKSEPLTNLDPGEKGIIAKITKEESDVLQHLAALEIMPGVTVEVEEKAPFNGFVIIKVGDVSHTLKHEFASIINVRRD